MRGTLWALTQGAAERRRSHSGGAFCMPIFVYFLFVPRGVSLIKTYFYIARLRMQTMLAYRFEVWSYMLLQILMMIAIGYFWKAVYAGVDISHDVSVRGMITYTVISALISSLSYMGVEDRITDAVKSGSIATDMIKPINLFSMYLAEDIGNMVINLFRSTLPILAVGTVLFGLPVPASGGHFCLFLLSFLLGYGINWAFSATFSMLAFSAISLGPAFSVKYHFVNLLSGVIIPIWFFPGWLQMVLQWLPFAHIFQTPLSIYIGKYDISTCLQMMGIQVLWLAALGGVFYMAQRRATRRVLVQGG